MRFVQRHDSEQSSEPQRNGTKTETYIMRDHICFDRPVKYHHWSRKDTGYIKRRLSAARSSALIKSFVSL